MSDSNLKKILEKLIKINELSQKAIDELEKQNNESNESSLNSFIGNLSLSINSLSKETVELKELQDQLSTQTTEQATSKSSEDSCNVETNNELEKDPLSDPLENCPVESGKEIVSNSTEAPADEDVEDIPLSNLVGDPIPDDDAISRQDDEVLKKKPFVKIVDFEKLVDPRNLEFMNKNQKNKEKSKDASIIVLSSSDDEVLCNKKTPKKTSGEKSEAKSSVCTRKAISEDKEPSKTLSNSLSKSSKIHSNNLEDYEDIRLSRSRPYVKLLRVPCEEMKEFYLNAGKKETSKGNVEEDSSNDCSDNLLSNYSRSQSKSSKSDKDEGENASKKSDENKVQKQKDSSGETELKNKVLTIDSDSSDSETLESLRRSKRNNQRNKKLPRGKNKGEANSFEKKFGISDTEVDDPMNDCDSQDNVENPCDVENKKNSDSSGDETVNNLKKLTEDETKKDSSKESTNDKGSDNDKEKEKINSDKEIVLSSNDSDNSDFETFCRKNKFIKKRRLKKISDDSGSEGGDKEEKTEEKEDEKESSHSEHVSDKEDEEEQKRKRKRIREMDNDDSSDSNKGTTRRKIKKLISKDSLSYQTKKAAQEENERKQRVLEKQKKYNQIYESSDLSNSKVDKLILDIDEATDRPLLEVDKALVSKLKPHQASGIQFMWDACFESLERIKKTEGSGCILAHCMGLGKTLQVIALTHTLLEEKKTGVRKVLIVTPLSTVLNWKAEFKNWLSGEECYEVYEIASVRVQNSERSWYLKQWHENGGVMIITYSMFRNLSNEKNKKYSKKIRNIFIEALVDPGPDLVVCDEGHLLKNNKTSIAIAMNKIKTRRRIVLTGTPLQNNLREYYCMVHFVKPSLLGTYKEYLNRFVNPITNGQYTDSTQYDINLMRRRSHVLHKLLDGIVQRRDYSVLSPYLPPKFEYVLFLTLTETQKKLYTHYMEKFARNCNDEGGANRASYLFRDFQALSRICIHPRVLLDKRNEDLQKEQSDDESIGSLKDFIDDDSTTTTPNSSDSEPESTSKAKRPITKRVTRAQKNNRKPGDTSSEEVEPEPEKEWWQQYCDGEELENIAHSAKMLVLFEILKECEQIGDKVLIFSQSLYALDTIEYFLGKVDEATRNDETEEKTCGYSGSWEFGTDYFRLDGSTNCELRSKFCDTFNKESNPRARLFLLSTRAGGLGINLVGANRVIIFDVSWNPSSDVQSIYRVYRFGQLKPSYIYRFVIYGTMEMKIYERQVTKQAISKRVIDEQQIDRHYNQSDLAELYKFEMPDADARPIPLVPKDVLLGELLQNHEDKIFKYHEHQSLLENKEDETLNEEERKAAWDEFENEKVERTKQTFIGKFSISTVQLALRSIIQKDNPTWNNSQILSIIPQLIQQLNLQLSLGDQTMYNRIAAEIKLMQDQYARKMQMQFYQYRMQLAGQNAQFPNMYQQRHPFMNGGNRLPMMFGPAGGSGFNPAAGTLNPNDIVELN